MPILTAMCLKVAGSHRWKSGRKRQNKKKRKEKRGELVGRICTNFVVFHVAEGTDGEERKARGSIP